MKHGDLLFRSAGSVGQLDQILHRSMIQVPLADKLHVGPGWIDGVEIPNDCPPAGFDHRQKSSNDGHECIVVEVVEEPRGPHQVELLNCPEPKDVLALKFGASSKRFAQSR